VLFIERKRQDVRFKYARESEISTQISDARLKIRDSRKSPLGRGFRGGCFLRLKT